MATLDEGGEILDSILTSVKKYLGIEEDYTFFDPDVIMGINSAFMILTQLGIGPLKGFVITDKSSVWTDFLPDIDRFESVRQYVYLKTRLVFDPPQTGPLMEAMERRVSELEWRLNVQGDEIRRESLISVMEG